ncbi:MAG: hypothetical protein KGI54_07205 [Pseudomonadota bacterium]|nr:hypothetical protein [Pseudomonadota bacterium]
MENPEIFYMVYMEGGKSPTTKHTSRRAATFEAARLTEKTRMPTYILKAVGMQYSSVVFTQPTYAVRGISLVDGDNQDEF